MVRSLPALIVAGWMMVTSMTPADCTRDDSPPDQFLRARLAMVAEQIAARGVRDARVLEAMRRVLRHEFVPADIRADAYADTPLSIGYGQTISQPYIVALMTELARPGPTDRALEIGTGSGYQSAVLAGLVARVYSIELVDPLARSAAATLQRLGYVNVTVRSGDGYGGWPEEAPYDIILVTAAPDHVPAALVSQLRPGGRLVIPVGPVSDIQDLRMIEKDEAGRTTTRSIIPVRFVPLVKKGEK